MADHMFEPFQQVLVRNRNYHPWEPMHYGYAKNGEHVCSCQPYQQCIPYTPDTAHLLGTSQPYEPPKPPVEYEWGQKVAVRNADGKWNEAVFINFDPEDFFPFAAMIKGHISLEYFQKENIRPLEPANE